MTLITHRKIYKFQRSLYGSINIRKDNTQKLNFHEIHADILESPEEFLEWARKVTGAARWSKAWLAN